MSRHAHLLLASLPALLVTILCTAARAEDGHAPAQAKLYLDAPDDATVRIDGKLAATTPLSEPLALTPGKRTVAISARGYEPVTREVVLAGGKATTLSVDLDATGMRRTSLALMGAGGAGIVAGIVLGALSVVSDREAQAIVEDASGPLSPEDQQDFESSLAARDDFRVGSGVAGGVGLGLFVAGGVAFAIDGEAWRDQEAAAASVRPWLGRDRAGASLDLRF